MLEMGSIRLALVAHCDDVLLFVAIFLCCWLSFCKGRKESPQKQIQLSARSHPRHLVGKRTAQKDTIIDITSDSQVNSNFPYRWSPASLTFNNCSSAECYNVLSPFLKN